VVQATTQLTGNDGNDNLRGEAGNDTLLGGAGSDSFNGGAGNDSIDGGTITDLVNYVDLNSIEYSNATSGINLNLQTGVVSDDGLGGQDQLTNINFVAGSGYNDVITGSDRLLFEQFEGGAGDDTIDGGAIDVSGVSSNRATYVNAGAAVTVNLSLAGAQNTGGAGTDTLININHLRGSNFNDVLTGSDATAYAESFNGGAGVDAIDGRGGRDQVRYDTGTKGAVVDMSLATGQVLNDGHDNVETIAGIENLRGGNQNDSFTGDAQNNLLEGFGGNDTLVGGQGADTLTGGDGDDSLTGGTGTDLYRYGASGNGIDTITDFETGDVIGVGATLVAGTAVAGDGSTVTNGGVQVSSNAGVTTLYIDTNNKAGAEVQIKLSGTHAATAFAVTNNGNGTSSITLNNNQVITGTSGNDNLSGGSGNDTISGLAGNDYITAGGDGASDTVDGGDGNDIYSINFFNQTGPISFTSTGPSGTLADTLGGTDTLSNVEEVHIFGGSGADSLTGDSGRNWIMGNGGNDTLTGGGGSDSFAWDISKSSGTDRVTDLSSGESLVFQNQGGPVFALGTTVLSGDVATGLTKGQVMIGTASGGVTKVYVGMDDTGGADLTIDLQGTYLAGDFRVSNNSFGADLRYEPGQLITGDGGNNNLQGGSGNDTLQGLGGDDNLQGAAGSDSLDGGGGNDRAQYGFWGSTQAVSFTSTLGSGQQADGLGGTDTLTGIEELNVTGGSGNDTLVGGAERNFIEGGAGDDSLTGGGGTDSFAYEAGAQGRDLITDIGNGDSVHLRGVPITQVAAGDGTGLLKGQVAVGTWNSGSNITTLHVGMDSTAGADLVIDLQGKFAAGDFQVFNATDGNLNYVAPQLTATAGNDNLVGSGFGETIDGLAGNDVIAGRGGDDNLIGGLGFDTADYGQASGAVTVNLGTGSASGADGNDSLSGFESVTGSNYNDTLTGDANNNNFTGRAGDDVIDGGLGSDSVAYWDAGTAVQVNLGTGLVTGGSGNDSLTSIESASGSNHGDLLTGSTGNNNLRGEAGNDTLLGGAGSDSFNGGAGNDSIDGGTITDLVNYVDLNSIEYSNATSGINLNLQTGVVSDDGLGGQDQLTNINFVAGSGYNDVITGSDRLLFEQFEGGAGDDTIDGGAIDGTGVSSNRATYVNAGAAVTVNLSLAGAQNTGGAGTDTLININHLRGSNFNDVLTGSDATAYAESFNGGAGVDVIDGRGGRDQVRYDTGTKGAVVDMSLATGQVLNDGHDNVETIAGIENLRGGNQNDSFTGDAQNNLLEGFGGNDTLVGGQGADTLTGGDGDDSLTGGTGTDLYRYGASGNGIDTITDFETGDVIGVGATLVAGTAVAGDGSATAQGVVQVSANAGVTTLWVGTNATAGADVQIKLTGTYTASQFTVTDNGNGTSSIALTSALTLTGTASADALVGGVANDTLSGLAGNDTLTGGTGNDVLDGGADTDTASYAGASGGVTAYLWNSQATGADGSDTLTNIENLVGSGFDDRLDGANTGNSLDGGTGADTLYGYAGNDTLTGGAGNDTLDGGADLDTASYAGATGAITALLWNAQASGADGTDTLFSIENLTGSGFNDRLDGDNSANGLSGGAGADSLYGYGGNDTLSGGAGDDVLDGSAENDTATYAGATGAVTALLWNGQASGADGADLLISIENLVGSGFNDRLDGDNNANVLDGGAGADTMLGYDGNDTLVGGAGNDSLTGGNGNDTFRFAASANGIDTIADLTLDDTILVEATLGTISAGNGSAVTGKNVQVSSSAGVTTLWIDTNNAAGAEVQIKIAGTYAANNLKLVDNGNGTTSITRAAALNLSGTAGNETLTGAGTNDTLSGLAGNDVLIGGAGNDALDGGADSDTASYAGATGAVTALLWNGQATGADGTDTLTAIENLIGSGFNDRLDGDNNANSLSGGAGADSLYGYGGNDTLAGGAGNDAIDGGADVDTASFAAATGAVTAYLWSGQVSGADGTDTLAGIENLVGSGFNDRLDGDNNANVLDGGAGADTMLGYDGNDTLVGGAGNDSLTGGNGNDTFRFAASANGIDTIADLTLDDTILVEATLGTISAGNGSAVTGKNVQVSSSAGVTTLWIDTNNAAGAEVQIKIAGTYAANNLKLVDNGNGTTSITRAAALNLSGTAGNETLTGAGTNDTLSGLAGNDVLIGGAGNDALDGGADSDTASYAGATGAVTALLWNGQATGADGTDTLTAIENLIGSGFNDRLDGDNNANSLSGGAGADSLYGYGGNDTLAGGAGNDAIDGGADVDTASFAAATGAVTAYLWSGQVSGADGTDTLAGIENLVGSGFNDRLDGDNNANVLDGGAGADTMLGYDGNDTLVGGAGNDSLTGGNGNDTFRFAASANGIDTIADLTLDDTILVEATLGTISAGNGSAVTGKNVQVSSSAGVTTLWIDTNNAAGAEVQIKIAGTYAANNLKLVDNGNGTTSITRAAALNLSGTAGNETLTGAGTNDTLSGLAGNDVLIGGAGNDALDGGADSDTASYAGATGAVTAYLWNGQATGADGTDTLTAIENLIGSGFNDRLDGDNNANSLSGGAGADSLYGYGGNDTLSGGLGDDLLDGSTDIDTASYATAAGPITAYLWNGQATGEGTDTLNSIENLIGSGFNDRLDGTNTANVLGGGAGADSLYGYAGNDTLTGGAGNDVLDGGADIDTVSYAGAAGPIMAYLWSAQATGEGTDVLSGIEILIGSDYNDRLDGDNTANSLSGGTGADTLYGYGGNDTVAGGTGNDVIDGGADIDTVSYTGATGAVTVYLWSGQVTGADGTDTVTNMENLIGSAYNDRLDGTNSANSIEGGLGADTLFGYSGSDTLTGGAGNDALDGGADADAFMFDTGSGVDLVYNFATVQGDKINLKSGLNGSGITSAAQALAATTDVGGFATVNLGSGHTVTLVGVTTASLSAADFVIF
jgi:Ca2+-binding RTX toxin-like protein